MNAYLHYPQLHSCLGADLATAAAAVIAARPAVPDYFVVHERGDELACLHAQPQLAMGDRSYSMLESLRCQAGSFAGHLLIVASTGLDIANFEQLTRAHGHFSPTDSTPLHHLAGSLQHSYGFSHSMVINTACSSAANALLYGARLLPEYAGVVVLAFEPQSTLIQQGFAALELTSASGQCRPFQSQSDGLVLGEACAAVLLNQHAEGSVCRLLGGYSACDTSSVTGTREDGSHILHVSRQALASAEVDATQIDLVKLHGTATQVNDAAEAAGSQHWLALPQPPAFCVLKPWLGHNLGACGLTETLLLSAVLQQGFVPVSATSTDTLLLPLATDAVWSREQTRVLANFFGFGGNNACLVLEVLREEQPS